MYKIEAIDIEDFPVEVYNAFRDVLGTVVAPDDQDWITWPLVLSSAKRSRLSDDQWESYRAVTEYVLDELQNAGFDDGEIEIVLIAN